MEGQLTCYFPLGKNLELGRWCYTNAKKRAGIDTQWLIIGWNSSAEVEQWCQNEGIKFVPYEPVEPFRSRERNFLVNLYNCWNLGYQHSETKWVTRMGSDQFFSQNWLLNLYRATLRYGENSIYHCYTIESDLASKGRLLIKPWGTTWDTFKENEFDQWALENYSKEVLKSYNCKLTYWHPVLGPQLRPDGCTWLQTRDLWLKYGPLPPFEDVNEHEGIDGHIWLTGDVVYLDNLKFKGIRNYLVKGATTYHLVQGETRKDPHRSEINEIERRFQRDLNSLLTRYKVNMVKKEVNGKIEVCVYNNRIRLFLAMDQE